MAISDRRWNLQPVYNGNFINPASVAIPANLQGYDQGSRTTPGEDYPENLSAAAYEALRLLDELRYTCLTPRYPLTTEDFIAICNKMEEVKQRIIPSLLKGL